MAGKQQKDVPVTPQDFPSVLPPNYPSVTHDFTLQAVMEMQKAVGQLCEAVNSLKEQYREHDKKLDQVVQDVHGAKVAGKALLWVVGVVGTLLGIVVAAYFRQVFSGSARQP